MMNEICLNCGREKARHSIYDDSPGIWCDDETGCTFKPSGRVSVPVDAIKEVIKILGGLINE